MNEKENLIATYLANRDGPPERAEPGHFYITDLLAFAEGTALPELATTIEAHCVSCEPCRSRIESSRIILGRDEDLSELPLAGSLLEFVVTPPEPRPEPPPGHDTNIPNVTPVQPGSPTDVLATGTSAVIRHEFAPLLRLLLTMVGIEGSLTDPFLEFILTKRAELNGRRFRHVVNDWLTEFAQIKGICRPVRALAPDELDRAADIQAVRDVLTSPRPAEPDWARRACEYAASRDVSSWRDLAKLSFPEDLEQEPRLGGFVRALADAAKRTAASYHSVLA